jgi:protein TonB
MNLARFFTALLPALGVTLGLLLLMHFLIASNLKAPDDVVAIKIPDIVMPERQIETKYDTQKPDKPDEPEEPPPELPEPEFQPTDLSDSSVSISMNMDSNINIGGVGGFSSDGEFLPIVKVAPQYPRRALSRGIEGYCTVEYTVTKSGAVRDPVVVDAQPEGIFDRASIQAALKFRYKPRVIDGEPVDVAGVRNRFTYTLEQ